MMKLEQTFDNIRSGLSAGTIIPYLGPGVWTGEESFPASPQALVAQLTSQVTVPHKIRNNLTAAAQYIENFKHRKSLVNAMTQAFTTATTPNEIHRFIASYATLPLIVDTWYDAAMASELATRKDWGEAQGVSQSQHFGTWVNYFNADRSLVTPDDATKWKTLLYKPMGSVTPAENYLVSDTDFVEVLTEIDIQTPIPAQVQQIRSGRNFLFIGCRFSSQIERNYARQIMKRSSDRHWAVIKGELTKNEKRFVQEQNIDVINLSTDELITNLTGRRNIANAQAVA